MNWSEPQSAPSHSGPRWWRGAHALTQCVNTHRTILFYFSFFLQRISMKAKEKKTWQKIRSDPQGQGWREGALSKSYPCGEESCSYFWVTQRPCECAASFFNRTEWFITQSGVKSREVGGIVRNGNRTRNKKENYHNKDTSTHTSHSPYDVKCVLHQEDRWQVKMQKKTYSTW